MIYFCCTEKRRNAVKQRPFINGIEYIEVVDELTAHYEDRQKSLLLFFIHSIPTDKRITPEHIRIEGGERVKDIEIVEMLWGEEGPSANENTHILRINLSKPGDFSTYTLRIVNSQGAPLEGFDPMLSAVDFSFKVNCPSEFDCHDPHICPPQLAELPDINYLAKDYAGFRRLMLDRMALLAPDWKERNPADMGIVMVELLAYVADYLSYRQDAVATEAYLGTARKRISATRHAKLIDYSPHNGCNARTWLQINLDASVGEPLILNCGKDKQGLPIGNAHDIPKILSKSGTLPKVLSPDTSEFEQALQAGADVFELMHDAVLREQHNEMYFHTWGEEDCCLPKGATQATLFNNQDLQLLPGDFLILAEVLGPENGREEDADPVRRHPVRLTEVKSSFDYDYSGEATATSPPSKISVLNIKWDKEDALPYPLCISRNGVDNVSVAWGNIVLADHGLTVRDGEDGASSLMPFTVPKPQMALAGTSGDFCESSAHWLVPPRYRPRLVSSPLTFRGPAEMVEEEFDGETFLILPAIVDRRRWPQTAARLMTWPVNAARPIIALSDGKRAWRAERDLLDSNAYARSFVVEIESDGTAYIRFGNDINGARPKAEATFSAAYRLGNGQTGNIGADSLGHIATANAEARSRIQKVWNPLPATGGLEPESMEEIRQNAPQAFRTQERAVIHTDYEAFARRCDPDIQHAACTFRWTGSWRTALLTIDRFDGREVDERFAVRLRECLERYRMAGFDLKVDAPRFVSLEIDMEVCAQDRFLASDVKKALLDTFSNRRLLDGRLGVFHPDQFTFGQPVYLSRLYAAAQATPGVDSVKITRFQRQGIPDPNPLEDGKLLLGRREIARCDNDPNFPEHGFFHIVVRGGRAF